MTDRKSQYALEPSRGSALMRQLAVLPLVFAGALMFWTMALSLGAFSLIGLGALTAGEVRLEVGPTPSAVEPMPGQVQSEGISVQIQESAEPEDVEDNAGAVAPAPSAATE